MYEELRECVNDWIGLLELPDVSGTVATPKGDIVFSYTKAAYTLTIPEGMEAEFRYETGEKIMLTEGVYALSRYSPKA